MMKEQASTKLSTLSQKKDKNFYVYYCWTEDLLIGIFRRDQVSYNRGI